MRGSLFWEDVDEGMELPALVKEVTLRQLVKYAGAADNYAEIHYDKDHAQSIGLPGPVVHGALKSAFLAQLVNDWIGEGGTLKKLSCQYRGMDVPGDTLICKGTVTRKFVQDGQHMVDCRIWAENAQGKYNTPGSATVVLPSRSHESQRS